MTGGSSVPIWSHHNLASVIHSLTSQLPSNAAVSLGNKMSYILERLKGSNDYSPSHEQHAVL